MLQGGTVKQKGSWCYGNQTASIIPTALDAIVCLLSCYLAAPSDDMTQVRKKIIELEMNKSPLNI